MHTLGLPNNMRDIRTSSPSGPTAPDAIDPGRNRNFRHRTTSFKKGKSDLKILTINAEGLRNKRAAFHLLIEEHNADIVCITESKIDSNISSQELFPAQFNVYRKDRDNGGGGVITAVRSNLISTPCPELDADCEIIWVCVHLHNTKPLYIGNFYRPPNKPVDYWTKLEESLDKLPERNSLPFTILTGDFNCPEITWPSSEREDPTPGNHHGNYLLLLCDKFHFKQTTPGPTRTTDRTANLLDLVLTNLPNKIGSCEVQPGISDHDVVATSVISKPQLLKKPKRKVVLANRGDYEQMRKDALEISQSYFTEDPSLCSVQQNYTKLKNALLNSRDANIPSKMARSSNNLPWVTRDIRKHTKKRNKLHKKAKISKLPDDWDFFLEKLVNL